MKYFLDLDFRDNECVDGDRFMSTLREDPIAKEHILEKLRRGYDIKVGRYKYSIVSLSGMKRTASSSPESYE